MLSLLSNPGEQFSIFKNLGKIRSEILDSILAQITVLTNQRNSVAVGAKDAQFYQFLVEITLILCKFITIHRQLL